MPSLLITIALLSIIISILVVYIYEVPTGVVFFTLSIGFLLFGFIDTKEFLSSFFDETLLTIVTLIFISKGLEFNKLIKPLRRFLLAGKERNILIKLNVFSTIYSMFVNNAAVVSTMIGILKKRNSQERLFMMSISFASILGGMLTLVGTSTNLIVNNLKIKSGFESWTLLDFFAIGITPAIFGLLYLSKAPLQLFSDQESHNGVSDSVIEVKVKGNSKLIGKTIEANGLRNLKKLFLGEVIREDGKLISPATPFDIIQKNDRLIFIGEVSDVNILSKVNGLEVLNSSSLHKLTNLKEVLVTDESDLIGLTPKLTDFRSRFNAVILSIRRGDRVIKRNIGEEVFRSGDQLTLAIGSDFKKTHSNFLSFQLSDLAREEDSDSYWKSVLFLLIFFGVLVLNLFGVMPLFKGTLIVLLFALITKILSLKMLKNEIPYNLVMTVGSAFVISNVLKNLQAPDLVLSYVLPFLLAFPIFVSLFLYFLFVIFLTEFVSNAVAAGIAFPFAVSLAAGLSTPAEPFFLVTAFGASASFLTPFGYHTNMMVYSVGHYKPVEFLRLGLPLTFIYVFAVYLSILYQFNLLSLVF